MTRSQFFKKALIAAFGLREKYTSNDFNIGEVVIAIQSDGETIQEGDAEIIAALVSEDYPGWFAPKTKGEITGPHNPLDENDVNDVLDWTWMWEFEIQKEGYDEDDEALSMTFKWGAKPPKA